MDIKKIKRPGQKAVNRKQIGSIWYYTKGNELIRHEEMNNRSNKLSREAINMISDEELDRYRLDGTRVRVVRDADPANDVRGFVMAWDDKTVLIRKMNRKVIKLDRNYIYQPYNEERKLPE